MKYLIIVICFIISTQGFSSEMNEGEKTTSGLQVYFDTTELHLAPGTVQNGIFQRTVGHKGTEIYFKLHRIPTTNIYVGNTVVFLNGKKIFEDDGTLLSQFGVYFDTTVTTHNGSLFKVQHSSPGGSFQYGLYLDVKFSADLTVGVETNSETDFKIYPDPVQNELNVQTDQTDLTYEIYSMDGKLVLPQDQLTNSIDVSSLTKGYYLLKLTSKDGVVTEKFLKQ